MKKILFLAFAIMCAVPAAFSQTTILDFETPATSTTFQYFGSGLDGTLNQTIANPNPTGLNTSSMVAKYTKPGDALVWAGVFSNPNPTTPVDLTGSGKVAIKVHMDHIGLVSLKLENSSNGGSNWVVSLPNTKVNEWEVLVFDPSLPSIEAPNMPANGHTYSTVTLFFDFGTAGTGSDVTSYFDDIAVVAGPPVVKTILDFETPGTLSNFQYFGSPLDGTLNKIVPNPHISGIDSSSMVAEYIKPASTQVWAGAFSNPNPTIPVDLSNGGKVCIKVWMDHIGNLALKLENSTSGQASWIQQVSNTKINEWEELCFDATLPSLEAPFTPPVGAYATVTLFFDFGQGGSGVDVTSYFDDVVVKSSGAIPIRTVKFVVDMNNYTNNFNKVYVSGTFNNWSGDANPLTDANFDGIWEGDIKVPNGVYEYKVTLDNWAAQEAFLGTEECTKTDPSGQFVNRLLLVSADGTLPKFCYNSCYACGEEVNIKFKLGMGTVTPSPDGVWLAGGGNFDAPGGRYKLKPNATDGTFELSVPRRRGFHSYYDFANGACPDYSCKENLSGLPCGDPNNYFDRILPAVQADTLIATCFGQCSTNADCTTATQAPWEDARIFTILGNPTGEAFSVLNFGTTTIAENAVTLTNPLGQVIDQWFVAAGNTTFTLPTANLAPGMYFVTVKQGNRFFTRKLVK